MKKIITVLLLIIIISGCSKTDDKKPVSENKSQGKENPHIQNPESQTQTDNNTDKKSEGMKENNSGKMDQETSKDEKAEELIKIADESFANYNSNKAAGNLDETVSVVLTTANYLMFDSNLPPRQKYRPALKYYNKVLEIEPKNEVALKNKKQIEDIYESMGMPVPK